MVKSAKKMVAILVLLILVGTLFPFRLKSFLQWIWAALPLVFLSVLWLTDSGKRGKLLRIIEVLCLIYTILIVTLFGCMKWYSARDLTEAPDYILIFGAEMREDGVSPMLARRCDKGYELSVEYPGSVVIVSGWQGPGDASNEAEGMKDYLISLGLSEDRIIVEPDASDTLENILFSRTYIGDGSVAMVSDDFHLFRIGLISRYYHVNGMPVSCSDSTIRGLRFWFREVLSIAWSTFRGIVSSYN